MKFLEHVTNGFPMAQPERELNLHEPAILLAAVIKSPLFWFSLGIIAHCLGSLLLLLTIPAKESIKKEVKTLKWKWRTTQMARINATISGSWAVLILLQSPYLRADLMEGFSLSGMCLISFSIGVHSAEAVDMLCHKKPSMLLIHHMMAILCFTGALYTGKAVGFAILSLITEVNTIFNKTRIIYILVGLPPSSEKFRKNARINLTTFFIRICIVAWMNYQAFLYFGSIPFPFFSACAIGLSVVNIWNITVFWKLCASDFAWKAKVNKINEKKNMDMPAQRSS